MEEWEDENEASEHDLRGIAYTTLAVAGAVVTSLVLLIYLL